MRPAAMDAVSEVERTKACPHRDQAAVNLARAKARGLALEAVLGGRMPEDTATAPCPEGTHSDGSAKACPIKKGRRAR
jgi:hypothetical protein